MHVDFDHFYAQCEEIRRPELRARPTVVCVFSGRGGDSGAVATANYAAREFGVKSGMPIRAARARLKGKAPDAEFVPVDFAHYAGVSRAAMDAMEGFADVFEYVGKDEAYMDVTRRSGGSWGPAAHLAQQVKNAVRDAAGITCSAGVTPNKLLSKIASDYRKPDGLTVVTPEKVEAFLEPLGTGDIPGIGGKTAARLGEMGIRTIGELRAADAFALQQRFGRAAGARMRSAAMGLDADPVAEREPNVQYSRIATLERDSADYGFLAGSLDGLCAGVHRAVAADGRLFKSVGVLLVQADLTQRTKSRMLRRPTADPAELRRSAGQLLREALLSQRIPVRRLGVRVSELSEVGGQSSMDSFV